MQYILAHLYMCVWAREYLLCISRLNAQNRSEFRMLYNQQHCHDHGRNKNDFPPLIWLIYIIYTKTLRRNAFWNFSSNRWLMKEAECNFAHHILHHILAHKTFILIAEIKVYIQHVWCAAPLYMHTFKIHFFIDRSKIKKRHV